MAVKLRWVAVRTACIKSQGLEGCFAMDGYLPIVGLYKNRTKTLLRVPRTCCMKVLAECKTD